MNPESIEIEIEVTWTTVSTSSSSLGCVRNHEGAMSSRALAEGWSWAPVLTSNASSTLLGLSCLLTEYTAQKGIVLLELARAQEKGQLI